MKQSKVWTKQDFVFISILIVVCILFNLPQINYPMISDSIRYSELADSIRNDFAYNFQGVPEKAQPPLFPAFLLVFQLFFNPFLASKIAAISLFVLLMVFVYYFARRLTINSWKSFLFTGLIASNPFFFQVMGGSVLQLSEGLGLLLLIAGYYLYYFREERKNNIIFSGVFFGLAAITRIPFIFFTIPLIILELVNIWKRLRKSKYKRHHKYGIKYSVKHIISNITDNIISKTNRGAIIRCVGFIVLTIIPVCAWFLRNVLITTTNALSQTEGVIGPYMRNISRMGQFVNVFVFYVIGIILILHIILPVVVVGIKNTIQNNKYKFRRQNIVVLLGIVVYILLMSLLGGANTEKNILYLISGAKIRYMLAFLPIILLITMHSLCNTAVYNTLSKKSKRYKKKIITLLIVGLVVNVSGLFAYNNGCVQGAISEVFGIPTTSAFRQHQRAEAIDWLNDNAAYTSVVISNFRDPSASITTLNDFVKHQVRSDITILKGYSSNPSVIKWDKLKNSYLMTELDSKQILLQENLKGIRGEKVSLVHSTRKNNGINIYLIIPDASK